MGVVFVNYHSEKLIHERAPRLLDAGHQVVVADNSSSYRGPGTVIDMDSNAGFARACNRAVASLDAGVDVICLHNPDVDVHAADLARLTETLRNQPRPGIAAPAELTGGLLRLRGYHYPSVLREAIFTPLPFGFADRSKPGREAEPADTRARRRIAFRGFGRRYAAASLVVIDRAAWSTLGGFDERYFLYCEDLDLWHRLGLAGFTRTFRSDIVMHHHFGASSPVSTSRRELARWLAVELFFETYEPRSWPVIRAVHRRFLWRHRNACPHLSARIAALWDRRSLPSDVMSAAFADLADAQPRLPGRRNAVDDEGGLT